MIVVSHQSSPLFVFLWYHYYHNKISENYVLIYIFCSNMSKNVSKELTFNNVAIKSLSFWISFAKVIHIFGKTKFFFLLYLNANYFDLRVTLSFISFRLLWIFISKWVSKFTSHGLLRIYRKTHLICCVASYDTSR